MNAKIRPLQRTKTAIAGACLFLSLLHPRLMATEHAAGHENYSDLISKAQNLTLQHDRLQATQILIHALKAEKAGPQARQLRKTLSSLASVFYTERAQKIFESAQALSDPRAASDKLSEALQAEPGNTQLYAALARARIWAGECAEAIRNADSGLEMDPYSPELQLARLQALQCSDDTDRAHNYLLSQSDNLKSLKPYADMAAIRDMVSQRHFIEARRKAKDLTLSDSHFPEPFWVLFRIGQELGTADLESGERYLEICQKTADSIHRKYDMEPSVCLAVKDAEREVKNLRAAEEKKN